MCSLTFDLTSGILVTGSLVVKVGLRIVDLDYLTTTSIGLSWTCAAHPLQLHQVEKSQVATKELVHESMPRKPKRNDVPVKLDADVVRNAKIVATFQDTTLAEYLSELLRPLVERDLAKHLREEQ